MHISVENIAKLIRTTGQNLLRERSQIKSLHSTEKSVNQLVTDFDIQTERTLIEQLQKEIPDSGFITEESQIEQNSNKEYVWIIDPIDGTTNFIHGLPVYSISVALMRNNGLILGVVYELNQDELFYAEKGKGAFLNGKSIQVSGTLQLSNSLIATGFPYYDYKRIDPYLASLKELMRTTQGVRRMGSAAVDLAYVAAGRFDAFYEYSLNPWDVAAGILIVQEAGGTISGFHQDKNPLFDKEIIASCPGLIAEIQHIIQSSGL
jgi:myo-inositol-1(or 4)-monophosphatase